MRIRYKYYIDNQEVTKALGVVATKVRLESVGRFTLPNPKAGSPGAVPSCQAQVVINSSPGQAQYLIINDESGLIQVSETVNNLLRAQRSVVRTLKQLGVEVKKDTRKRRNANRTKS